MGIILFLSLTANLWQWSWNRKVEARNETITKKNQSLQDELEAKKNNTEENVKNASTHFLKAMFTWENGNGMGNIQPFVTKNALDKLQPLGAKKSDNKVDISSNLDKATIYYSPINSKQATILTRVYRTMTVNNITSKTSLLMELEMIYKDQKWLVDDAKILTELTES